MMMESLWTFVSLYIIAQTTGHNVPVRSVKAGERVTLYCTFKDKLDKMILYKQRFGEMPQTVGENLLYNEIKFSPEFNKSGLIMNKTMTGIFLTFLHIHEEDEGLYFCEAFSWVANSFTNGTFISVTGEQDFSLSVVQNSELVSFSEGESLNLQCSVLSTSRSDELQVFWFRSATPQSGPQIIYSHHKSNHQCTISSSTYTCMYNFTKNNLTINDTGTYYCAVVMCGKIIFGNGTTVQLDAAPVDYLWKVLAVTLVVCIMIIIVQSVFICKTRSCKHHRVPQQQVSVTEKINNKDCDAPGINYAALRFSERKIKDATGKRQPAKDCVYSEVTSLSNN